jgi:hypothetical protein|tara:strand:+ start:238 stop:417 length:180 start_codon:yes stop_codon:yes gene_type:complete
MFLQITMAVPDHASIAKFYRQTLGMTDQRDGLGYGAQQAHMNFYNSPYRQIRQMDFTGK